ncbi:MAG TPA: M20/M25/M40 family metallo-hydrolase, partial [Gemmatimonadales bacterium]|nr:M20/M25/M40 family metallo-hydrolase [Gemmatimonadales bacterium]
TLAALTAACAPAPSSTGGAASRPAPHMDPARLRPSTTEKFDPKTIPAYAGTHPEVYAHIESHRAAHLEQLRRWVRQPSVSAENQGIRQMAELLRDDLTQLGFREAALVPTSGHPGVWGWYDAGAPRTLVVYMMYDVQPVDTAGWKVPGFDGAIVDHPLGRALMARGATNQKGPERAFLNAVESIIAVRGKLPVNLMVAAEGEEELGSPHFPEVVDRYASRLRTAAGVIFPSTAQAPSGSINVSLGAKGIVYFELEAKGDSAGGPKTAEVHGSLKALVDAPAWRLAQGLATLTTSDGNTILVPGYQDAIRPPSAEEWRLLNGAADEWTRNEPRLREVLGVDRWIDGISGPAAQARLLFTTTLNIDGIWGGYTGPGTKTILPHKATAKLDSRLVPDQHPDSALALIRRHLDAKGFTDLEIRKLSGYPPSQSSVEAPLVRAALGVYNKVGVPVTVAPRGAGSAPYYVFTDLGLPMVQVGIGHGSGAHAPNEYVVVEPGAGSRVAGLVEMEKFYVDLLYALAEAPR